MRTDTKQCISPSPGTHRRYIRAFNCDHRTATHSLPRPHSIKRKENHHVQFLESIVPGYRPDIGWRCRPWPMSPRPPQPVHRFTTRRNSWLKAGLIACWKIAWPKAAPIACSRTVWLKVALIGCRSCVNAARCEALLWQWRLLSLDSVGAGEACDLLILSFRLNEQWKDRSLASLVSSDSASSLRVPDRAAQGLMFFSSLSNASSCCIFSSPNCSSIRR